MSKWFDFIIGVDDTAGENIGSKPRDGGAHPTRHRECGVGGVLTRFAESVAPTHDITGLEPFPNEVITLRG